MLLLLFFYSKLCEEPKITIQHKNISEANLHESKGVSTALVNTVFRADGMGSGVFQKIDSNMLKSLTGDAGVSGKGVVSDGGNGFALKTLAAFGSQTLTNNPVNFPLVAVADTTFNTPTQYTLLSGVGAPWLGEQLNGVTFTTDRLTASVSGTYRVDFWCNIAAFTGNTAKVSFRHRINGTTYMTRKPTIKSGIAGDTAVITSFGLVAMSAGDYLQLCVASDTTGNLLLSDADMTLSLMKAT